MPPGSSPASVFHDHVDQRNVDLVDARDAEQAQSGALGRVGRVLLDVLLYVVGDGVRRGSRAVYQITVQLEGIVHLTTHFRQEETEVVRSLPPPGSRANPFTTSNIGRRSPIASATAEKKTFG